MFQVSKTRPVKARKMLEQEIYIIYNLNFVFPGLSKIQLEYVSVIFDTFAVYFCFDKEPVKHTFAVELQETLCYTR